MHNNLHILIMAGGSGTRFWPKSRTKRPKQLLALWDEKTLIEHTVERFLTLVPQENIWIVTTDPLISPTKKILDSKYPNIHYLNEPNAKNTAPCILYGIKNIHHKSPSATVAVMPADHFIGDVKAFEYAILKAVTHAETQDGIVTLGVKPNRPETGYGYIETQNKNRQKTDEIEVVENFVEKPDLRTALRYIESGKYYWNAGMFIFKSETGLKAFESTMPHLYHAIMQSKPIHEIYESISKSDSVSIDYGVIEVLLAKKTKNAADKISVWVTPTDCGWNDVGSFPALEEIDRATMGKVITHQSQSNIVQTDDGLVALLGVNDLVVIREGQTVLVAAKDRCQDIKTLLEKIKKQYPEYT